MPTTLLATVEVAARLGIERSTITRWVQLGKLTPVHRPPGARGAMLFDPVDIDRLAADLAVDVEVAR